MGAGLGGLTAAIALARRGVEASVSERASSFAPAGAGITLQPNATAVLDALGVAFDPTGASPPADLPAALAAARRPRVAPIHRTSWRVGQVAHLRRPAARWLRDLLLGNLPNAMIERVVRQTWAPGLELADRLRPADTRPEGLGVRAGAVGEG